MNLPEFSVKRRITISMFVMIVTLFGVMSFGNLGLDLLPEMEFPYVSIVTTYEGAGPEEIESLITKPMEESLSMVDGIKNVYSVSTEGMSAIYLEFNWGVNLDFAAQDAREALSWVTDYLPEDADTPMVVKFNTSTMPVLEYGVTGMDNTMELRDYLYDNIKPRLERLEGIASVFVIGGREREIQILVDPEKLKATGLSLEHVVSSVQASNLNISAGHVAVNKLEYQIRTRGYYDSLDEISKTIISISDQGQPIFLQDVARVEDGFKEQRGYERTNGKPCVIFAIMKQSGENTLQAVNRAKAEIAKLEAELPEGVRFDMVFDQGEMIQESIASTGSNALMGALLAILVIFLFLRSFRPTLTIAIAIPLSVITTFIGMNILGYTFNMMTLGGLALGIGLLVDNAVVVIENTFRHLENGEERHAAAINGTREVGLAITASTLTTMAVFLPMSLSQSIAGKLARPLSLTVCLSLLASLMVAITIIPAIASTIFKPDRRLGMESEKQGIIFWLQERYARDLRRVLKHKGLVLLGAFLALVAAIVASGSLGSDFMPKQDVPMTIMDVELPEGAVLEETNHIIKQIEALLMERPEVINIVSQLGENEGTKLQAAQGEGTPGSNKGRVFAKYVAKTEREKSVDTIMNELRDRLPELEGVEIKFQELSMTGPNQDPIRVSLYGADIETLFELSNQISERVMAVEGFADLNVSLKKSKPELHIEVDRQKAAKMGLNIYSIASTVETAMEGRVISRYHEAGDEYDIRVRFAEDYREHMRDIENINIASPIGFSLPLSQVTNLEQDLGPINIGRKNLNRVVNITGRNVDRDLGSMDKDIRAALADLRMPDGYFYDVGGTIEDMKTSQSELGKAFLVAILLIYMIMAAQFESLSQPLIVMFSLPLAFIGVIFGLFVTGKSLSVPSIMGLIILMGIVVNNGIVMIDYINHLRRDGMQRLDAIVEGARVRLRPILITSITTIFGMLPMAFSSGQGSEMRSPMAVAVSFGLLFAMVLTLFVVPSAYAIVDSISTRIRQTTSRIIIGEDKL